MYKYRFYGSRAKASTEGSDVLLCAVKKSRERVAVPVRGSAYLAFRRGEKCTLSLNFLNAYKSTSKPAGLA